MTGTCLCGGVAYEVKGELGPIALCHCGMCRKQSGTAFATNASVERRAFRLVRGTDLVQRYQSSPGKWRCFSRRRGSERERGGAVAAPLRPARSARPGRPVRPAQRSGDGAPALARTDERINRRDAAAASAAWRRSRS
ncbi:MAG: GFA family protein [Deltaproteobacteria bacterium]|nr:MAG: GFA family protein [Deltaproteobacteria bacterium]